MCEPNFSIQQDGELQRISETTDYLSVYFAKRARGKAYYAQKRIKEEEAEYKKWMAYKCACGKENFADCVKNARKITHFDEEWWAARYALNGDSHSGEWNHPRIGTSYWSCCFSLYVHSVCKNAPDGYLEHKHIPKEKEEDPIADKEFEKKVQQAVSSPQIIIDDGVDEDLLNKVFIEGRHLSFSAMDIYNPYRQEPKNIPDDVREKIEEIKFLF